MKKNKCAFENCKKKIGLLNKCKYCNLEFCNNHRLIFEHNCPHQNKHKTEKLDLLSKNLLEQKHINQKIIKI